jgi:hypothetical protein
MVTPIADRNATGRDGIAQPAQTPSISTPNGRGRRTAADRAITSRLVAWTDSTPTIRWR